MKAGKKDGPKPKLKDKMRAALQGLRDEERRSISREPARTPKRDRGCKKA